MWGEGALSRRMGLDRRICNDHYIGGEGGERRAERTNMQRNTENVRTWLDRRICNGHPTSQKKMTEKRTILGFLRAQRAILGFLRAPRALLGFFARSARTFRFFCALRSHF